MSPTTKEYRASNNYLKMVDEFFNNKEFLDKYDDRVSIPKKEIRYKRVNDVTYWRSNPLADMVYEFMDDYRNVRIKKTDEIDRTDELDELYRNYNNSLLKYQFRDIFRKNMSNDENFQHHFNKIVEPTLKHFKNKHPLQGDTLISYSINRNIYVRDFIDDIYDLIYDFLNNNYFDQNQKIDIIT